MEEIIKNILGVIKIALRMRIHAILKVTKALFRKMDVVELV
jgi:hypothetical protein